MPAEKLIQFSDYQPEPKGSSLSHKGDIKNLAKSPGNMGSQGTPVTPLWENSEEPIKARSDGQEPETDVSHISDETKVSPIAAMKWAKLKAAYPGEFQSWKNRKHYCKVHGLSWASEWEPFRGFMLSKGPMPGPGHTLDRIDPKGDAYGPGLCRWANITVQNNNKTNNLKVVVPLTGEALTPKKVAKRHGVTHKTACKWFATYSPYELLIGKKSKALHAAWVAVDNLLISAPAKNTKNPKKAVPAPTSDHPRNPYPPNHIAYRPFQEREELAESHHRVGVEYCMASLAEFNEMFEEFGGMTPEEHERGFAKWWKGGWDFREDGSLRWWDLGFSRHVCLERLPTWAQELIAKIEAPGYVLPTIVKKHPDPAEIVPWKPRDRTDAERAQMEQEDVLVKEWEADFFRRQRVRCSFFDLQIPGLE